MMGKLLGSARTAGYRHRVILVLLITSYIVYMLGIAWPFVLAILATLALYVPAPTVMRSWLSRIILSVLVLMSTAQLLASLQFILLPKTDFRVLATMLLLGTIWLVLAGRRAQPIRLVSRADLAGLLAVAFFLLPFAPIAAGMDSFNRIARIGGIQAIDSTNHYASITEIGRAERFTYKKDYYYPKGFYLGHSFIQTAFVSNPVQLNWQANALLFLGQYLWYGAILGMSIWYLVISLLRAMVPKLKAAQEYLVALCLGPPLAILYLLSFVAQGFLNYYYVLAVILIGFLYLLESTDELQSKQRRLTVSSTWALSMYLLLAFGASASWPLLTPPLLLIALLQVLPGNLDIRATLRLLFSTPGVVVLLLGAAHLIPLYFQLRFSSDSASEGINLTGTLRAFHPYLLLLGLALTAYVIYMKELRPIIRRTLAHIMASLYAFVGAIVFFQLFTAGEVRYYAIKTSLLLEIMTLILLVTVVGVWVARYRLSAKTSLLLVPLCLIVPVLLIVNTPNPLKDVRDLFRDYSGTAEPNFFDHDTAIYTKLGNADLVRDFNTTVLHYNQEQGKFYAHMQVPFWSNMMQYSATHEAFHALHCVGALYSNFAFGQYTDSEQAAAIAKVKECAAKAQAQGRKFYVVTDEASVSYIRQAFGNLVQPVYQ